MESFPGVPAVAKHPLFAVCRHWGGEDSPIGMLQTFFLPHHLQSVSLHNSVAYAVGEHTQHVLAELRGTR